VSPRLSPPAQRRPTGCRRSRMHPAEAATSPRRIEWHPPSLALAHHFDRCSFQVEFPVSRQPRNVDVGVLAAILAGEAFEEIVSACVLAEAEFDGVDLRSFVGAS